MQFFGLDVQDAPGTVSGFAAGNFKDEGEWIAFVQQPQFSLRLARCAGIHEDATLDQVAVHIAYHAADITLGIGSAGFCCFLLADIDVLFYPFGILEKIPMVHGIDLTKFRALDIRMA